MSHRLILNRLSGQIQKYLFIKPPITQGIRCSMCGCVPSSFSQSTRFYNSKVPEKEVPGVVQNKYNIFRDEDSPVILDIEEERRKVDEESIPVAIDTKIEGLNLQRGVTGVFEIEEVVDILKREGAEDIFVAALPKEYKYVDYMVVVTGRSTRHMRAMAEFLRRLFKLKMFKSDIIPKIEGESSSDWVAIDLGNIAVHIFSRTARMVYDLDSLWSLGKEYDEKSNEPDDPIITMLKEHSVYLGDLTAINEEDKS